MRSMSVRIVPQINLSKNNVLVDEKVQIQVAHLLPGQQITLQALMTEGDKVYGSCGHYIANHLGEVDTFRDISHGGTYEGCEPMGLFWSIETTPGTKPGRLVKSDVMSPYVVTIALHNGFQKFESLLWSDKSECLCSTPLYRSYSAPGVRRFPVKENGLCGVFFVPTGEGPFPAVIDLFGFGGGLFEFRSALLASRGFASFVVGYVGLPGLPKSEIDLDFHYFLKAFDWLAANPLVNRNCMGGVGTCVGGGYLSLIASKRPMMRCLVSVSGLLAPYGHKQKVEDEDVEALGLRLDPLKVKPQDGLVSFRQSQITEETFHICPSWRHGAKILHIIGLDDQCVNPAISDYATTILPENAKSHFRFIHYPGAGHLIEPPYAPLCSSSYNLLFKMNLSWGGNCKQHSQAQEDSWAKILSFLEENIGQTRQLHQNLKSKY